MRKILTAFALAAVVTGCCAQNVSAADTRAEKSPLDELAKKVKEVGMAGVMAGEDRAVLSKYIEKLSVAYREGKFCEASKGLGVFKFYVSRFGFLGRFQNEKDGRKLASLADKAARKIKQHTDGLGINCDAAK